MTAPSAFLAAVAVLLVTLPCGAQDGGAGPSPVPATGHDGGSTERAPPPPDSPPPELQWATPAEAPEKRLGRDSGPVGDAKPIEPTVPARRRGPDNWTYDLGAHGYLVRSKVLFGGQLAASRGIVAGRIELGAAFNSERVERFDTSFLGPYGSASLWVYAYRAAKLEARVGAGVFFIHLSEIDDSLLYFSALGSVAANYFFIPHLSLFAELDALPWRTDGFEIGIVPVIAQAGIDVTLW